MVSVIVEAEHLACLLRSSAFLFSQPGYASLKIRVEFIRGYAADPGKLLLERDVAQVIEIRKYLDFAETCNACKET